MGKNIFKIVLIILIILIISFIFQRAQDKSEYTGNVIKGKNIISEKINYTENIEDIYIFIANSREVYQFKPNLGIILGIKSSKHLKNIEEEKKEINITIITNSKGFREESEIPFTKPKNQYRIIGLGDSITSGTAVDNNETFLRWIEKEAEEDNIKIETINFGVPGSDPAREYIFLKNKQAEKYSPDLIILVLNPTDKILNGKREIEKIKEYCKESGIDILAVYTPFSNKNPDDIKDILKELNIETISMTKEFYQDEERGLFWDDIHPNKKGHEIIGKKIYRTIFEL
jgi:lysophospholipase L1-like esterase